MTVIWSSTIHMWRWRSSAKERLPDCAIFRLGARWGSRAGAFHGEKTGRMSRRNGYHDWARCGRFWYCRWYVNESSEWTVWSYKNIAHYDVDFCRDLRVDSVSALFFRSGFWFWTCLNTEWCEAMPIMLLHGVGDVDNHWCVDVHFIRQCDTNLIYKYGSQMNRVIWWC